MSDKKNTAVAAIAVVVTLAAVIHLVLGNREKSPRANPKPFEHLGRALAEETASLVGGQGSVVLAVETMGGAKSPSLDAQIHGFKTALGKTKGISLKGVTELSRSVTEDPQMWPREHATRLVKLGEGAKALVFLGSFPQTLPPTDIATLKGSQASLVVLGTQSPLIQSLVTSGVIRVAVVNRTPPTPVPPGTETTAQWYARVYQILKAP